MNFYYGQTDKKAKESNHTAFIVSSGKTDYKKTGDCTVFRKFGREDWSLFYVTSGEMDFDNFGVLKAGEFIIYPPKIEQKYTGYSKNDATHRYVHFTGQDIFSLLKDLKIEPLKVQKVEYLLLKDFFKDIEKNCWTTDKTLKLKAESSFLALLSLISETLKTDSKNSFNLVLEEMHKNLKEPFKAEKYAKMLTLSVSRFNHVFKKEVGVSPLSFIISARIENAKQLLKFTDLRIKNVALSCGYDDVLYFSKAFKKQVGISPMQFRKNCKY